MSDYRTDRPYWCESCARQKDCYGITLRPKCFVPIADCKTENSSEKPNNSNLTFKKRTMHDCYNCKRYETEGECIECHYEPKDEPQIEYCPRCGMRILVDKPKDEPQTEREGE